GAALLLSPQAHEAEGVPEDLCGGGRSAGELEDTRGGPGAQIDIAARRAVGANANAPVARGRRDVLARHWHAGSDRRAPRHVRTRPARRARGREGTTGTDRVIKG